VSISKAIHLSVDRAIEVGCVGTFQIFTSTPRRWAATPITGEQAELFKNKVREQRFLPFVHMPYMPNLASPDHDFHLQSVEVLIREIRRCAQLDIKFLVLHFGSHQNSSIEEGQRRVIEACKKGLRETPDSGVTLLLETSAGTRNSLGSRFEDVRKVIDGVGDETRIGVCLDTCHVFSSGYDIRNNASVSKTLDEFDNAIGLSKLRLIHLNDSKGGLGEGKDRHEHIGRGQIKDQGFKSILSTKKIQHVPFVLETPIDAVGDDKKNVAHAKMLAGI
jgi:deoxyribonuclease-4